MPTCMKALALVLVALAFESRAVPASPSAKAEGMLPDGSSILEDQTVTFRDRILARSGAASPGAIQSDHANSVQSVDVKPTAIAAEIKVLCSNAYKAVMQELASQFERATKHKVVVSYSLAATLKREIESGEPFDVAVLTPAAIDDLIKGGKVVAASRTPLARTGLAIAIRAGSRRPDIATVETFKRSLLGAKSIAYAKEGASGMAFAALIQRLGIADDLKARSKLTATGEEVGEAVARGEAEFGVLPVSEILPLHGVELLGPFPADTQTYIVMVAGVGAGAGQGRAARDLIEFLTAPAARQVIEANGMERGAM
jgi:molybdate transport system substrate-binding protein